MSIFGKNIKKIRVLKNLSQQDFGDLFEISRGSIGSYEEGRAEPKIETVIKIANHYNISLEKLLTKELTVNDVSHFANKISNVIEEDKKEESTAPIKPIYIEDRIAKLEEKVKRLEDLLKKLGEI